MGIFDRLFGRATGALPKSMTDNEAMKVINAYGKAIMEKKSVFGDLSALPYPKARIKEAIIHGIKESDDPKFREQLKAAYVALAEWQQGSGDQSGLGDLISDEVADPAKAMARVAADRGGLLRLSEQVAKEATSLHAELQALGI